MINAGYKVGIDVEKNLNAKLKRFYIIFHREWHIYNCLLYEVKIFNVFFQLLLN